MTAIAFHTDPNDLQKSVLATLGHVNEQIAFHTEDDGRLVALRYKGDHPDFLKFICERQTYGMVRPEKGKAQQIAVLDFSVSERQAEKNPAVLQRFINQGYEIMGYVDNRYVDLFGLVQSDDAVMPKEALLASADPDGNIHVKDKGDTTGRRVYNNLYHITMEEAALAVDRWWTTPHLSLAEAKRPILGYWSNVKGEIERVISEWNMDGLTEQARMQKGTENQKPDVN